MKTAIQRHQDQQNHLIRDEKQFLQGMKDAKMGNYPRTLYPSEDYCRGYNHVIDKQN